MDWYFINSDFVGKASLFLRYATASGIRVFNEMSPFLGMYAVVIPAPVCKQASTQSKAAPMVS